MWEPGTRVLDDRFRIDRALSPEGGAEVYAAEQLSLSRKVALRIFRAAPVSARFDEEVRRLATVDHPAVVRVIDSGQSETTRFLVSELPEGSLLADELKGEPLMPDRSLELLTQLAEGLAAIHGKGLVHGDLRAGTVVLVKGVSGEQARLADFGLARLIEPKASEAQATVIGLVVGPEEIAAAAAGEVPGDLYAFGALAYQLLSGVLPARPAAKPLAEAAPHLADQVGLCALVMRCLAQEPALRPGSAAELAKTLANLPRPTEPTIFLEAMQRPPPVPAKSPSTVPPVAVAPAAPPPLPLPPAVAAPFASSAQGPRPLLASVATLIVTPPIAESALAPPIAAASRRRPMIAVGAVLLIALVAGAAVFFSGSTRREARHLIERRQPVQALEILGKAQRKLDAPSP
ncbi:MAG: pkn2, partial [Myxococcaceae bacterium]|nr:pkn2 [Myxococcaceae bacterium]